MIQCNENRTVYQESIIIIGIVTDGHFCVSISVTIIVSFIMIIQILRFHNKKSSLPLFPHPPLFIF